MLLRPGALFFKYDNCFLMSIWVGTLILILLFLIIYRIKFQDKSPSLLKVLGMILIENMSQDLYVTDNSQL